MKRTLALALLALAAVAPATAAAPAPIALSATPTVVTMLGATTSQIQVVNPSRRSITVGVSRGNYAISATGRVRIDPKLPPNRTAKAWLSIEPKTLHLGPNGSAYVTVVSHPPAHAEAGDHHALVLLTARSANSGQVAIRTRIGIGVLVRMPGAIVRKLAVSRLHVTRRGKLRMLSLRVANLGNVNERLPRGKLTLELVRGGKRAALRARPVDLLAKTTQRVTVAYRGRLRGIVRVVVKLRPTPATEAGPGITVTPAPIKRTFSARL
jgi:hypothetical protein